jgi:hypothetical protein
VGSIQFFFHGNNGRRKNKESNIKTKKEKGKTKGKSKSGKKATIKGRKYNKKDSS